MDQLAYEDSKKMKINYMNCLELRLYNKSLLVIDLESLCGEGRNESFNQKDTKNISNQ